ncbi:type II restriction endonuclease [Weeksellaceae bacterium KMM 9724]|uniref:type II restriction endonuclease n=1 Tax=Profundicola chukchiensis TaxID=2961959 RepID=UPI002438A2F9|nr:type II restriction endonuclease [Profundicola chukchiensis]MDG4950743.1 type II restriction endonuclease [Profundicola chukchiensis]
MPKSFEEFLSQLSTTNSTLDYFVDFDKIIRNVDSISIKLNQLNYLIGQENLESAVVNLFKENKSCFSVLDIIIAVRDNRAVLDDDGNIRELYSYFETPELVYEYLVKTGLADVFKNKQVKNLVDFVFGIEVGLDTNARKNRGGKNMEKAIGKMFSKNNIPYQAEVRHTNFPELIHFGKDVKRFDFVIKTKENTYLIETNFYNSGGSKLNEVARSYTDLAPKINQYDKFEFVWITDGKGWKTAKNKLQEAYTHIPHVYNLKTLPNFINRVKNEL